MMSCPACAIKQKSGDPRWKTFACLDTCLDTCLAGDDARKLFLTARQDCENAWFAFARPWILSEFLKMQPSRAAKSFFALLNKETVFFLQRKPFFFVRISPLVPQKHKNKSKGPV